MNIVEYLPEQLWLAAFAILILYCLKSVVMFIPLMALYISAGILFPVGWALLITCAGLFCEMSIGYYIGTRLRSEKITAKINKNKKVRNFLARSRNISPLMCFSARFLPLPFDLVTMYFGASAIKYQQFVLFTYLGAAPKIISLVIMGELISSPFLY